MNLEKARLRMLVAQEIGKGLEEKLHAAENMVTKQEGARDGLKEAAKGVAGLMAMVDLEFKDHGTIGGFKVEELSGEPLRMMKVVKSWIQRAIGCVDNLATTAEMTRIATGGKVKGLHDSVEVVKKSFDEERNRIAAVEKGLADGTIVIEDGQLVQKDISKDNPRAVGMPPGPTLKEQRQAEEQEAAKASMPQTEALDGPVVTPPTDVLAEVEKPKKRRASRKKTSEADAGNHS